MALQPTRFKLDEEIALGGKPLRVAGLMQFEAPDQKVSTRYFLAAPAGTTQILEDLGERMALLRPFPPATQPEASGDTVSVMGAKYKLSGVRKLKVLGSAGSAPKPGAAGVLLSGVFEGSGGALLREMTPGTAGQSFYSLKTVGAGEVQDAAQLQAAALAAQQKAAAAAEEDDEAPESGGFVKQAFSWIVTVLVLVGLAYACSGDSDDSSSSSSGSARSSVSVGHGGK